MELNESWHLLLVEDDEDDFIILRELIDMFDQGEHQLNLAATYDQGLEMALAKRWDAVLVDYELGIRKGTDLIREARNNGARLPFILVTGRGSYQIDRQAMEAGAIDYISKDDLKPLLLERTIHHAIERFAYEEKLVERLNQYQLELQIALELAIGFKRKLGLTDLPMPAAREKLENELYIYVERLTAFPSAYLLTDTHGVILAADFNANQLFKAEFEQLTGKVLSAFILPDEQPVFEQGLAEINAEMPDYHAVHQIALESRPPVECCFNGHIKMAQGGEQIQLQWFIHHLEQVSE